jgi:hypothetical protein
LSTKDKRRDVDVGSEEENKVTAGCFLPPSPIEEKEAEVD